MPARGPSAPTRATSARVFREMEATLDDADIDVHLTWNGERLPDYGTAVVAVLLRDDGGRVPRYAGARARGLQELRDHARCWARGPCGTPA